MVSGKDAEKIQDFTTINLNTAERIAETCEKAVTAKGGGQHTITVLDNDGNRVYMDRMDGQSYINIVTSDMKARTALMGREPSKTYANRTIAGSHTGIPGNSTGLLSRCRCAAHRGE